MSEEMDFYEAGFVNFEKLLKKYSKQADIKNVLSVIQSGADEFINDVRALPKPRRQLDAAGYTHLLDTVCSKKNKDEIEVGWGKYYGPMVERGTKKFDGTPHMKPTFEKNKYKYYKTMIEKILN